MLKTDAILIFDIGKTNKKVLLFDRDLKIIDEEEIKFPEVTDDDGFSCDDIENLEKWIDKSLEKYVHKNEYNIVAVNFTTYGATLGFLDNKGKRITPVYNYLKPMPEGVTESLYNRYGGVAEFSRRTASPALGMLNSGLQIPWLKKYKPEIFKKVKNILHFPQYLSFRHTGKIISEHTSIGCHTAMWDFDDMKYHQWLADEGIILPDPVSTGNVSDANISGKMVKTGTGIHDSSASLIPYLKGSKEEFILLSTGTWCINMNPFNHTPLTANQLENDCLCYMSISQKPVKSSRVFIGHLHDVSVERLSEFFKVDKDHYKKIRPDKEIIDKLIKEKKSGTVFFRDGFPENNSDAGINPEDFRNFNQAYHCLMTDLTNMVIKSLKLIIADNDKTRCLYISGGFAKNELFTSLLADRFKDKKVYTSTIDNATSLGAAMVMYNQFGTSTGLEWDLDLKKVKSR